MAVQNSISLRNTHYKSKSFSSWKMMF